MAMNPKTQQTLEPVHVRTDHPQAPSATRSTESVAVAPSQSGLPAHTSTQPTAAIPQKPPKVKQPPKKGSDNNVTAAITATVIIVLGLAALAVYAYIRKLKSRHA